MENEIKVGEYVRLKNGEIFKIDENTANYYNSNKKFITNDIIKHSPNLIDLIQCGDYVNGYYVNGIDDYGTNKLIDTERDLFDNKDIETVVTKEQFKSISFKV